MYVHVINVNAPSANLRVFTGFMSGCYTDDDGGRDGGGEA